jgi:hypothetical protein
MFKTDLQYPPNEGQTGTEIHGGQLVQFGPFVASGLESVVNSNMHLYYLIKQIQTAAPKTRPLDAMKDELFRTALRKSFR